MATGGNKGLGTTATAATNNIGTGQGVENQAQNIANSSINTSGGLSPLVSKQLANETGLIGKSYTSAAQAANRGLSQRGMGIAPSGLSASINNSAINNEGLADTNAVGGAFGTQNQLNQTALNPVIAAEGANTGQINAATGANQAVNNENTILGDVGLGISGLSGLANSAGNVMGGIGKMNGNTGP